MLRNKIYVVVGKTFRNFRAPGNEVNSFSKLSGKMQAVLEENSFSSR